MWGNEVAGAKLPWPLIIHPMQFSAGAAMADERPHPSRAHLMAGRGRMLASAK
eukprot:CAMPEP_0181231828 /NCGR_PEP_ID=MMETSP1096-20121128/35343_1 /TAXON_ID=156174 ORGANISM="Chrysochromulina ericina, Strain CCMP281" /NCGR_SAMPLE_ID=MMETSP1096 /ASSEMBLY_ACC=CAM_ASM_000453 /LENGTH=52 /DNA_ID=CAMNT_0023325953 /DNA_START=114 /DNA_END=269 /DNA_ORIENTATION=+